MADKKADIFRCAKEIFSQKGFKDTKITDITEAAGIAAGTFYNFYSSKEELFLEIYLAENEKLKSRMAEKFFSDKEDAADDLVQLLKEALAFNHEGLSSNPILKEWYNPDGYAKIERYYREKNEKTDASEIHDYSAGLVKRWQTKGLIRTDIDLETILALFHSITYIDTHKEAIGIQFFPAITTLLAEFVMEGLKPEPGA
jgi:AcrR family transcriptional regulator